MQQQSLNDAVAHARKNVTDEEVRRLANLAASHLDALRESDNSYKDQDFYTIVKEVSSVIHVV